MELLSKYVEFKNGKKRPDSKGSIPVYGGNGILDYTNVSNMNKGVVIGRVGVYCGSVFLVKDECWVSDNAIKAMCYENMDLSYLYYLLSSLQLNERRIGTSQPLLTQNILNNIEVDVPALDKQKKIASILESLDKKIQLNNEINNNLEQQSQAIFQSWFIDYEPFSGKMPEDWTLGILGDFVEIKRGGSPRPIQEYLAEDGFRWLKISDATGITSPYILDIKEHIKESGLKKTVFLNAGSLVLSNSATPGIPKILDVDSCIHDGWLYFPKSMLSNEYLYLYFKYIRKGLVALGNGSVFTNLKTDILKNYPTALPSEGILADFESIIQPMFEQILTLTRENHSLNLLRDTLLPKLMSGELDVTDIDL